mmetsp:Transcript_14299/g.36523  ORF Transcript_14299/g.36523 Transcript_14299/m.36523 type:complete len:251 (+) Transcript_14299:708-1460(+)
MNSRSVPWYLWMTSEILPRACESRSSTSFGERSRQTSSNPSISTKRMVVLHLATPIVASMPVWYKRSTTQGGTYMDQDRMALRMPLKAVSRCCNSSATWTDFGFSTGSSASRWTSSRHDMAIMSSTNERSGCSRFPENMLIFMFRTYTKISSSTMTKTIVKSRHSAALSACAERSTSAVLLYAAPASQLPGQQDCTTSLTRTSDASMMAAIRSLTSTVSVTCRQRPFSQYERPSRYRNITWSETLARRSM